MTSLQTTLVPLYYLHDFMWRLCRASKDPRFGQFRVHLLILFVQVAALTTAVTLIARALHMDDAIAPTVILSVLVMTVLNEYLFSSESRRSPYARLFRQLSAPRRRFADTATAAVAALLVASPALVTI